MSTFITHRSPYTKVRYKTIVNGFFARDLDADDYAFLEQVRQRGIANAEAPHSEWAPPEEFEFWESPYTTQPDVPRRVGPVDRTSELEERRKAHEIRKAVWRARAAVREQDKRLAAHELEQEYLEHEKAERRRRRRQALSDAEWEAADPQFGGVVDRHYIPQWKIEESARVRQIVRAKNERKYVPPETEEERETRERMEAAQVQQQLLREREALDAARANAEAHRAAFFKRMAELALDPEKLSRALMEVMRQSRTTPWTVKMLARSTGCDNEPAIRACLTELMHKGYIQGTIE